MTSTGIAGDRPVAVDGQREVADRVHGRAPAHAASAPVLVAGEGVDLVRQAAAPGAGAHDEASARDAIPIPGRTAA